MRQIVRFGWKWLVSAALLSGCCANDVCDCNDQRADALYFQFQVGPDSLTGPSFGPSEVDTVYLLRRSLSATATSYDSLALLPTTTRRPGDTLFIDNNAPFTLVTGRKLNSFSYELMVFDRQRQLRHYLIENIALKGAFEGNGCCTCYANSGKSLTVNGQRYDVTETGRQPVIIPLRK